MNDKQYIIVVCASAIDLMREVNTCLGKGYIPLGGAIIIPELPLKWAQTLIRKMD
jgi:hypothetical protein